MSGAGTTDFFYREAQRLGYVARSAFKLQIQKQRKLITPCSSVLDLGCAPGAWRQICVPSVSGITPKDAALSVEMGMQALDLAVGQAMSVKADDTVVNDGPLDSASITDYNGVLQPASQGTPSY